MSIEAPSPAAPELQVRFRQEDFDHVFDVLLDNAVAAMDGASERRVVFSVDFPSPSNARIRFRDTGPGVPPELAQHIFDRGVTSSGASGKGMGLHYARRIMERYGGRIQLVDEQSSGACFELDFETITRTVVEPGP